MRQPLIFSSPGNQVFCIQCLLPHHGGEVVLRGLRPADQLHRAVLPQQQFRASQLPVVVVAHGVAVGAGVVDHQQIADIDLGQHPVHSELVAVLTQGAGDVVLVVAGGVLLARDGDVVVGPVDGRAHQVGSAGIHADILLVDVLFVDSPGHKAAIGPHHEAAQLAAQLHVPHPRGNQDLLIFLPHALADKGDVVLRLLRAVGDADAAGEVDVLDVTTGLRLQLRRQPEEDARQLRVVVVGDGVGGQEGVDAEVLGPLGFQHFKCLGDLGPGHAVFGVAGGVHHLEPLLALPQGENSPGIVPTEHRIRDVSDGLLQKLHMGDIVQIDDRPQPVRQPELLRQGIVGGEHDLMAPEAAFLRHHQFRQAGAVRAAALLTHDLQQGGGGGGPVLQKHFP